MVQPLRIQPFNFYSLRDFAQPLDAQQQPQQMFRSIATTAKEPEPEAPPPPPPPPTFSEAELEQAREQGRLDGHTQGLAEGMERARSADAERDTVLSSQLRQISTQLETLRAEHQSLLESRREEALRLGVTIAGMIATRALSQDPTSIAEDLVSACLPLLIDEPKLTLSTHPAITEAVRQKTSLLAEECRFEGILNVEPSPSLSLTECKLAWSQGEATRSQEEVWSEIVQRILPEHIAQYMPTLQGFAQALPAAFKETLPAQQAPHPAHQQSEAIPEELLPMPPAFAAVAAAKELQPDEMDEFAAYAPEYRIAREDENPIVQDILHTIDEVEQEQERKKPSRKRTPPPTEEM